MDADVVDVGNPSEQKVIRKFSEVFYEKKVN